MSAGIVQALLREKIIQTEFVFNKRPKVSLTAETNLNPDTQCVANPKI